VNKDSILIVDDNQMTRVALKSFVEDSGLPVDTCENGESALHIARENRHAVFLIDYRMPKMNGDEVTALLRASRPDAFIIGFSIEAKERVFLDAGANVFLNKAHLLNCLIQVIQNRGNC
jgi:CheY-like chemotaxis protein